MTTKTGIDKRSVYIPRPTEWHWETLSEKDAETRLAQAKDTYAKLVGWVADLKRERDEMWAELRERLPAAKLGETKLKLARIEDAGKQLAQLGRLLGQASTAIEYIERRMGAPVA